MNDEECAPFRLGAYTDVRENRNGAPNKVSRQIVRLEIKGEIKSA